MPSPSLWDYLIGTNGGATGNPPSAPDLNSLYTQFLNLSNQAAPGTAGTSLGITQGNSQPTFDVYRRIADALGPLSPTELDNANQRMAANQTARGNTNGAANIYDLELNSERARTDRAMQQLGLANTAAGPATSGAAGNNFVNPNAGLAGAGLANQQYNSQIAAYNAAAANNRANGNPFSNAVGVLTGGLGAIRSLSGLFGGNGAGPGAAAAAGNFGNGTGTLDWGSGGTGGYWDGGNWQGVTGDPTGIYDNSGNWVGDSSSGITNGGNWAPGGGGDWSGVADTGGGGFW